MRRLDFLKECNDQQVPLEDFRLAFCERCVQPECSRSKHGTSKFDQRVATWEDRLFNSIPRMDPSDPRYAAIQGKQFKMFNPVAPFVGTKSSWMDPRDLVEPPPQPQVDEPPPDTQPEIDPEVPEPETPEVPEAPPVAPQPVAATTQVTVKATTTKLSPDLLKMNTPKQSGRMLAGNPAPVPQPPKDPWAGPGDPKPAEKGVVIVKRGATVRLGGNGVE